jgi:two-component system cell cycle sensor histidine kinase/response regulator CckA
MPVTSAYFISLLLLAIIGGFVHLFLRRYIPDLLLASASSSRSDRFSWSLKPPGTAATASRPASATPFPPRATGQLILLVEDDASVRNMLSTVLLNHGYEVITARDGVEALSVFRRHQEKVALVVTDINMPRSNGRTFVELLRPIRPDVPVLFMSGLESNGSGRDPGSRRSKDPFLLKPFKPASLLNTVHGLLHPSAPRP